MAIFDPREQRLCVRVVYDGIAGAGKTTNLQRLATLFEAQRATQLYSPDELLGRTIQFDWMQLPAGVVAGIPLLCEVISVPGQLVLEPRRRYLLESADVVIYVCDSSEAALGRAREGLELLACVSARRGREVPIVVQANKQDQTDAVDGRRLLEALGHQGLSVVEAMARDGVGVVDTFVSAVRCLSRSMQEHAEREGLRLEVRCAESRDALHARVAAEHVDLERAAELLLEEASTALRLEALSSEERAEVRAVLGPRGPALPEADPPTGCVWPADTGRRILARLAGSGALSARVGAGADGSIEHRAGGYLMRSSTALRFDDAEEARAALVRQARQRTQLGALCPAEGLLVLRQTDGGAWWLWVLTPELPTLATALSVVEPEDGVPRALLDACGAAFVDALRTTLRHGFGLDLRPATLGVQGGALRYLGDPLPAPEREVLTASIVEGILALGLRASELDAVLEAFEREHLKLLTREELELVPMRELRALSRQHAPAPSLPQTRRGASLAEPAEP